jgi:hypothetical protein
MAFPTRLLVATALLGVTAAASAQAQRGGSFYHRPPYAYFRYRIPRVTPPAEPRFRMNRLDLDLRAMERSLDRMDRLRDRQFGLQERVRARRFELEDRAFRRQLDTRDRAMSRLHERRDGFMLRRPFLYRWRSRTI